MAYQLWTSSITGHRRVGTRFSDVRELFESGITAKSIFEPLKSCPVSENVFPVEETMRMRDFDVLGVVKAKNSPVIGYVLRTDLKTGKIEDHLRIITPEILISESAPIAELFSVLSESNFVFVLNKINVEGIVTQADLNKPPVRIYLFGLISLLEMHMGFWIRNHYVEDSWQNEITENRMEIAKDVFSKRKERNQGIDLFECLQFCDKITLLMKSNELRTKLSIESRNKGESILSRAEHLRNSLAHSQEEISQGMDWKNIFDTVLWIEKLISNSDQIIEKSALESAESFSDNLL